MNKPEVKAYIDERMELKDNDRIASQNEVLELLTNIARGNETEEQIVVENVGDFCSEAKVMDKQVGAKDRVKALELLGKRYGLFIEKKELSGNINTTNPLLESISKQLMGG